MNRGNVPITKLCAQALSLIPSNEDGWQHQCCSISFSTKPRAMLDLLNRHHVGKACDLFFLCIRCTKDQSSALHERKIEKGERWINLRSSHRTTLHYLPVLWNLAAINLRRPQKHFKRIRGSSKCDCLAVCCCSGVKRLS